MLPPITVMLRAVIAPSIRPSASTVTSWFGTSRSAVIGPTIATGSSASMVPVTLQVAADDRAHASRTSLNPAEPLEPP